jgi:DNA-binding transcriptional MerR regulator
MKLGEVAEKLGVNESTLKKWVSDDFSNILNVPIEKGKRSFSEDHLKVLDMIKNLREQDNGIQTINRVLGNNPDISEAGLGYNPEETTLENKETKASDEIYLIHDRLNNLETSLVSKFDTKLDSILELSEKYSRATYEIGSLKAQLDASQKEKLMIEQKYRDEKVLYLESNERFVSSLDKNTQKSELENQKLKEEVDQLKAELQKEKSKTWWQKFVGK